MNIGKSSVSSRWLWWSSLLAVYVYVCRGEFNDKSAMILLALSEKRVLCFD